MAETTIPKDWAEVRAAVNLVERGVKVVMIMIIIIIAMIIIIMIIVIIVMFMILITIIIIIIIAPQGEEMCSSFQCNRGERHSRRVSNRSNKF